MPTTWAAPARLKAKMPKPNSTTKAVGKPTAATRRQSSRPRNPSNSDKGTQSAEETPEPRHKHTAIQLPRSGKEQPA